MDRNGLAIVVLLMFLILASFSDASLISNYRKFAVERKDSTQGASVSDDKKSDEKIANEANSGTKLDSNESIKENKSGSEKENQTSKEDKKSGNEVNEIDKDKKSDTTMMNEESKATKLGSEQVGGKGTGTGKELDPRTENKPNNDEKPDPKPVDEPNKEESNSGKKQTVKNEKPGSESGKDESKDKKPDAKPVSEVTKDKPAPPVPEDSQVSKSSSSKGAASPPPPTEKTSKKEEDKTGKAKKKQNESDTGTLTTENCDGLSRRCTIQKDLIGCINSSDDGYTVVVLVQNKGESNLKANVAAEDTGKGLPFDIPQKQSKRISVSVTSSQTSSIVFRSEDNKCELPLHQKASKENYLFRFPTYDKLVTPINGAYFLILSSVLFGGTFACLKFSRRRRHGIPYQELEMGIPESVSAMDVETAEGWDEGWDDDWDNDSSVKSTPAHHSGSISANGLTSRSPNKDGWEDNWDD